MIKIQKDKTSLRRRTVLISLAVLVVILAGIGGYWYLQSKNTSSDTNTPKPATKEQIDSGNSIKESTVDSSTKTGKPSSTSDAPTESTDGSVVVSIPYADSTRLTVLIQGIVSGACTLTLEGNGQTITKTANIQSGPSSSTCEGFSYGPLGAGTWTATVSVKTSSATGSATQSITVK